MSQENDEMDEFNRLDKYINQIDFKGSQRDGITGQIS